VHRFKTAVRNIDAARHADAVELAVSQFLGSLTQSERASVEDAVGYTLPHDAGRIPMAAHDLTRTGLRAGGDDTLKALVGEMAQVFIIASNRLSQLNGRA